MYSKKKYERNYVRWFLCECILNALCLYVFIEYGIFAATFSKFYLFLCHVLMVIMMRVMILLVFIYLLLK